jgi:hypothetical protein
LSHETLGIESHQEQEPGLKSYALLTWKSTESELGPEVGLKEEKYESIMNVMEGHE